MKRILSLTLIAALIGSWLISATNVHAQADASLTAQVDRTELSTDDTLHLTLTLQTPDGSVAAFDAARHRRLSRGRQQHVVAAQQHQWRSELQHDVCLSFAAHWRGHVHHSHVDVGLERTTALDGSDRDHGDARHWRCATGCAANSAPQTNAPSAANNAIPADGKVSRAGSHDFFIETSIDKETPYQGEAVKHVTRLYSSMMLLGQPDYQAPQFVGFWHTGEPDVQQYAGHRRRWHDL